MDKNNIPNSLDILRKQLIDTDFLPATQKQPGRKTDKLTDKQIDFAREYIVDNNGTQAAIRAGYSEKSAARMAVKLLQNPLVLEEIERNKKVVRDKSFWTIQEIENKLKDLYEQIELDENPDRKAQIKVLELAMKYTRMFEPDINLTQNNQQININIIEK